MSSALQHLSKKAANSPITVFSWSLVALGLCFTSSASALQQDRKQEQQGNGYSHTGKQGSKHGEATVSGYKSWSQVTLASRTKHVVANLSILDYM